ncbi:M60 family metallopeptidase [Nonomuraea sp. NPDC047529]|uniref:M60 family metallopeptidase n=1 Tax=Nonomuraea sp. NPDC047529 TaxID=3155623 RepID=UPI00340902F0
MSDEQPHLEEVWATWTGERKLWVTARGGPEGANLQAQWPDGSWASIGDFRADGSVTNPDVPSMYMWDRNTVRLRAHKYGAVSGMREVTVRPQPAVATLLDNFQLLISAQGGPEGAKLEVEDSGHWVVVGTFDAAGKVTNLDELTQSLWYEDVLRLRITKSGLTFPALPGAWVRPPMTGVSAVRSADGKLRVSVSGGMASGQLQAQWPDGTWASIGDFSAEGTVTNPDVPSRYMWDSTTMRLRVHEQGDDEVVHRAYAMVEATVDFPQPRILAISPSVSAGEEEVRLQHIMAYADFQPTGYFAPAGKEITVTVYGHAPGMEALIGTPGLADRNVPSRWSPSMRVIALKPGINKITDPYGGIVHIRYTTVSRDGEAAWLLLGGAAQPIPYFVDGQTTAAQWRTMLARTAAPEVEMVGERVVIAALLPTAQAFKDTDPGKTLAAHKEILALQYDISGLDGTSPLHARPHPHLRLYAVETYSTAPPHATTGYIGIPHESPPGSGMKALLTEAACHSWVMLHEYGHHMQQETTYGGPEGIGEVSVNLYALAVHRKYTNEYTSEFPKRWTATQAYLSRPRADKVFESSQVDTQAIFEQLRLGLGEDFLPAWHKHVRAEHASSNDDAERKKWFVVSASVASGHDLCDFFADWGLLKETEKDIRDAVQALGLHKPAAGMTAIQPYT